MSEEDSYFVIHGTVDGISIERVTREMLLKRITPEEGYCDDDGNDCKGTHYGSIDDLGELMSDELEDDESIDLTAANNLIIIKGKQVFPTPKKVVEVYEIE